MVPVEKAGLTGKCRCGNAIRVPMPASAGASAAPTAPPEFPQPQAPAVVPVAGGADVLKAALAAAEGKLSPFGLASYPEDADRMFDFLSTYMAGVHGCCVVLLDAVDPGDSVRRVVLIAGQRGLVKEWDRRGEIDEYSSMANKFRDTGAQARSDGFVSSTASEGQRLPDGGKAYRDWLVRLQHGEFVPVKAARLG